ncbi:MAG: hypothetical protein WCG36_08240, partial [bacterium]
MDMELISDLFDRCIKSSEILGVDKEFRNQMEVARRRLPPLQIGGQGQIPDRNFVGDIDEVKIFNYPMPLEKIYVLY